MSDWSNITVGELRGIAKFAGLRGYSKLKRSELVDMLMSNGISAYERPPTPDISGVSITCESARDSERGKIAPRTYYILGSYDVVNVGMYKDVLSAHDLSECKICIMWPGEHSNGSETQLWRGKTGGLVEMYATTSMLVTQKLSDIIALTLEEPFCTSFVLWYEKETGGLGRVRLCCETEILIDNGEIEPCEIVANDVGINVRYIMIGDTSLLTARLVDGELRKRFKMLHTPVFQYGINRSRWVSKIREQCCEGLGITRGGVGSCGGFEEPFTVKSIQFEGLGPVSGPVVFSMNRGITAIYPWVGVIDSLEIALFGICKTSRGDVIDRTRDTFSSLCVFERECEYRLSRRGSACGCPGSRTSKLVCLLERCVNVDAQEYQSITSSSRQIEGVVGSFRDFSLARMMTHCSKSFLDLSCSERTALFGLFVDVNCLQSRAVELKNRIVELVAENQRLTLALYPTGRAQDYTQLKCIVSDLAVKCDEIQNQLALKRDELSGLDGCDQETEMDAIMSLYPDINEYDKTGWEKAYKETREQLRKLGSCRPIEDIESDLSLAKKTTCARSATDTRSRADAILAQKERRVIALQELVEEDPTVIPLIETLKKEIADLRGSFEESEEMDTSAVKALEEELTRAKKCLKCMCRLKELEKELPIARSCERIDHLLNSGVASRDHGVEETKNETGTGTKNETGTGDGNSVDAKENARRRFLLQGQIQLLEHQYQTIRIELARKSDELARVSSSDTVSLRSKLASLSFEIQKLRTELDATDIENAVSDCIRSIESNTNQMLEACGTSMETRFEPLVRGCSADGKETRVDISYKVLRFGEIIPIGTLTWECRNMLELCIKQSLPFDGIDLFVVESSSIPPGMISKCLMWLGSRFQVLLLSRTFGSRVQLEPNWIAI